MTRRLLLVGELAYAVLLCAIRLSADEIWRATFGLPSQGVDVAVGSDAVYVAGCRVNSGGNVPLLAKYGFSGKREWEIVLPWDGSANAVDTDVDGNIYVAGIRGGSSGSQDAFLAKCNSAGGPLWSNFWGEADITTAGGSLWPTRPRQGRLQHQQRWRQARPATAPNSWRSRFWPLRGPSSWLPSSCFCPGQLFIWSEAGHYPRPVLTSARRRQ